MREVLVRQLDAKAVIVGEDYRYGKGREGDVDGLVCLAGTYGYQVLVEEKRLYEGEAVSSTRIRESLLDGDLDKANLMLGEPYRIVGEVVHGNHLGGSLARPP